MMHKYLVWEKEFGSSWMKQENQTRVLSWQPKIANRETIFVKKNSSPLLNYNYYRQTLSRILSWEIEELGSVSQPDRYPILFVWMESDTHKMDKQRAEILTVLSRATDLSYQAYYPSNWTFILIPFLSLDRPIKLPGASFVSREMKQNFFTWKYKPIHSLKGTALLVTASSITTLGGQQK